MFVYMCSNVDGDCSVRSLKQCPMYMYVCTLPFLVKFLVSIHNERQHYSYLHLHLMHSLGSHLHIRTHCTCTHLHTYTCTCIQYTPSHPVPFHSHTHTHHRGSWLTTSMHRYQSPRPRRHWILSRTKSRD